MAAVDLFHVGHEIIRMPDIRYGRKNADFGQGFYLSDSEAFSKRWAREKKGCPTVLNRYELETEGLKIKRFSRDAEWFDYIYANRAGLPDRLSQFDVIIGPIANDTLYDTWGILTSGLLERDIALQLLMLGPVYEQTVIKTDRAAEALRFICATEIPAHEIAAYRETVRKEESDYQRRFAELLEKRME